jgi:hypothetical protein
MERPAEVRKVLFVLFVLFKRDFPSAGTVCRSYRSQAYDFGSLANI